MPFYDYYCENCKYEFEAQHSMLADPLTECPKCLQHTLKRGINIPHVYVCPGDDNCSLGLLADRNSKRFSDDQKKMLKEKHKTKKRSELEKSLKPGMKINKEIGHGERQDFI